MKLNTLLGTAAASLLLTLSAQATYTTYWDVEADAGSYAPVALGDDIELDGCGSNIQNVQNRSLEFSLCSLTDLDGVFSVNWFAQNQDTGAFSWLTTAVSSIYSPDYYNADTNLDLTISTGTGSFFSSVGTYAIGIYVAAANWATYSTPPLPTVVTANFGGDWTSSYYTAFSQNGTLNNGAAWSANFSVTEAVSVPEPAPLLLLIPGMLWIARREHRRKTAAVRNST